MYDNFPEGSTEAVGNPPMVTAIYLCFFLSGVTGLVRSQPPPGSYQS